MTTTPQPGPDLGHADGGGDAVLGYLCETLTALAGLAAGTKPADDAVRVDRISVLEKIKAAAAVRRSAGRR